jgi:hypothetical protein
MEPVAARQVAVNFLHDAPRSVTMHSGDAVVAEVTALDGAVIATADDDSISILGWRNEFVYLYRRHGEAIDTIVHDLRGVSLTIHKDSVVGGLITTGYSLQHPYFPRSGTLRVDARHMSDPERAAFESSVQRFLRSGLAE